MTRRSGLWIGLALGVLGAAGMVFGSGVAAAVNGSAGGPFATMSRGFGDRNPYGYGMMGGNTGGKDYGMMFGGSHGVMDGRTISTSTGSVSRATVSRVGNAVPAGVSVDRSQNRVVFTGPSVNLDVVGSPRGQKDETFRIAGFVNPTIVVAEGAVIHVDFINADPDMLHNFVVTAAQPPFAYAPMMQGAPAFADAATPFISAFSGSTAQSISTSFVASAAGAYIYLCTVPGHAAHGMYGRFVVQ